MVLVFRAVVTVVDGLVEEVRLSDVGDWEGCEKWCLASLVSGAERDDGTK
jgi:hypothetical protein